MEGKEIVKKNLSQEISSINTTADALMQMKHFAKMGKDNLCLLVQHAKMLNMDPLHAANKGLYAFNGLVGMYSQEMNTRIRMAGHSVVKDSRSTLEICILKGKRADNGDEMFASFSIEEAKQAQIYKGNWLKYPGDMLFARAIGRLGRQLFPDIIQGLYTVEEIKDMEASGKPIEDAEFEEIPPEKITEEQFFEIRKLIGSNEETRQGLLKWLQVSSIEDIPKNMFDKIVDILKKKNEEPEKNVAAKDKKVEGDKE